MIADALKYLAELKAQALAPSVVHETRTSRTVRVDGSVDVYDKDHPARDHKVETLGDVVALANRFKAEGRTPVVWYNEDAIQLVVNDGDHRDDVVVLNLVRSDLFGAIYGLDPKRWYDPKSFVRLLRVELYGALDAQTLLDPVRRVRFDNGVTTKVENTRVRESLGREITSAVKTDVEIPEYVVLQTLVYTTPGVNALAKIKAAVEVDSSRGEFQLAVLPDEIESAVLYALDNVRQDLEAALSEGIPFYQGSPS
jgi:hypothetical protein